MKKKLTAAAQRLKQAGKLRPADQAAMKRQKARRRKRPVTSAVRG